MTEYIYAGYANSNQYVTLVSELNTSGRICGIGISRARKEHHFQVNIDNRNIHQKGQHQQTISSNPKNVPSNYFAYSNAPEAHNALTLNFEFENEMEIEIKDGRGTWPDTKFWVAYEVDDDTDAGEEPEIEDVETDVEDGQVFSKRTFKNNRTQRVYEGSEYSSSVNMDKDVFEQGEEIQATIRLLNWEGNEVSLGEIGQDAELHLIPEGRETPAEIANLSDDMVNSEEVGTGIFVEQPGDFELVANIEDVANFSSSFLAKW